MLVHKKKRVLVLKPRNPEHITATIPTAKTFKYRGATLVAVPHKLDEVRDVLTGKYEIVRNSLRFR